MVRVPVPPPSKEATKAIFSFHPCNGCEDKLIVFDGNINKKKLTGMHYDTPIYFYLVKI